MLASLTQPEFTLVAASAVAGFLLAFLILMVRLSSVNATARERQRSDEKAIVDLEAAEAALKDDITQLRHEQSLLLKRQGELEHQVQAQQTRHLETTDLLNTVEARFTDTFKALSSEEVLSTHLTNVKTLATVHREYHIKADDTTQSFRGYHVTISDEAHLTALKGMPEVDFVEQHAVVKASKLGAPHNAELASSKAPSRSPLMYSTFILFCIFLS